MASQEAIDEAIKLFGQNVVYEAMEVAAMSDPDGAYVMFEDNGMFEHAEAIEFLYFDGSAED